VEACDSYYRNIAVQASTKTKVNY